MQDALKPGAPVKLSAIPTRGTGDEQALQAELASLLKELERWQRRLYAEGRQALLVVLQGIDAAGKDSTINHVFSRLHPQGVQFHAFREPTPEEAAHDFLWRYHARAPPAGVIGIFNRSHYEGVLIERVDRLVPKAEWQARYAHINAFEQLLVGRGTRVLKFFLHLSKAEQKARFEKRLQDPERHWKFSTTDLAKRAQWHAYRRAYEDALAKCGTKAAPWRVIPADWKPARDVLVARATVAALKELHPRFPDRPDLSRVKVT